MVGGPIYRRMVAGYLVLAVGIVLGLWFNHRNERRLDSVVTQQCLESRTNRTALRTIIRRSGDVGRRGSPGYAYYRKHPAEKKIAKRRVDQALRDLPPIDCD